ncbi:uncharacterized protein [Amphiura filiformis]|uniref:uncharacterized protein n=1 Tax=Amphiura filiformis TaxID=82378 RepID=UPI003B21C2B0
MAFGRCFKLAILVWFGVLLLSNTSEGLTYEELVNGVIDEVSQIRGDPVIPHDVRGDGNVTVAQTEAQKIQGMVSFVFKGLPNHDTMMINPNQAIQQDFEVDLPEYPTPLIKEECLTGGPIGWTIHGVALFNPFNIEGSNAVEGDMAEEFDDCQGHPDMTGTYHYHQLPDACVFPGVDTSVHGIARDGFPIYGPYKEDGTLVQESELDKCHGRCGEDGKYRYHMTKVYPYILGCFRGTPMQFTTKTDSTMPRQRPPQDGDGAPPPRDGGGPGGPNQCAYNTVEGPNYEFHQSCPAQVQPTDPSGNGSGRHQAVFLLIAITCVLTWLYGY